MSTIVNRVDVFPLPETCRKEEWSAFNYDHFWILIDDEKRSLIKQWKMNILARSKTAFNISNKTEFVGDRHS